MIKAQFNASTLKASFVAADKKAQMVSLYGDDCQYCDAGETPKYLTATFSNLLDCPSCQNGPFHDNHSYLHEGIAAALNGKKIVLTQSAYNPCVWELTSELSGVYGTWKRWVGDGCSGDPEKTLDITPFNLFWVHKISSTLFNITAVLAYGYTVNSYVFYFDDAAMTNRVGCAGGIATDSGDFGCGVYLYGAYNGILTIEEGDTT